MKDLQQSSAIDQNFLDGEMEAVHDQLESLLKLNPTFRAMLKVCHWTGDVRPSLIFSKSGLEELFNQLIRPRLRAILQDVYKDQTYLLDDDGYAAAEANNLVRKRFVKVRGNLLKQRALTNVSFKSWEALMSGPKTFFTEGNYRAFFGMAIDMLVKPWEKMLGIMKFSEVRVSLYPENKRLTNTYSWEQYDWIAIFVQ